MSFTRISQRLCSHARRLRDTVQFSSVQSNKQVVAAGVCTLCGVTLAAKYFTSRIKSTDFERNLNLLQAKEIAVSSSPQDEVKDEEQNESIDVYQHGRERRFHEFASLEVEGELFMTPQDFLESVTDMYPRPRLSVRKLSRAELDRLLRKTPKRSRGSSRLFRNIHENGIISYSEYLFLLCILTKPKAGFKIAFKMFDTDGNERVDKQEFLVLEEIFRNRTEKSALSKKGDQQLGPEDFSLTRLRMIVSQKQEDMINTSVLVHLFGEKGNQTLSFEDFYQFMDNLQTEVLELEFLSYSHGMPTVSEEDFARILLRYTDVMDDDAVVEKLRERIPEEKGFTFEEFRSFFQFLNNLEDFAISVKMYAIAGKPIGEDEFHRAVKVSTGHDLSPHLVHTLYQLFDKDGDGKLSYVEFIGAMKDRLHRGFRSHLMKHVGWSGFKKCMKQKIKAANKTS